MKSYQASDSPPSRVLPSAPKAARQASLSDLLQSSRVSVTPFSVSSASPNGVFQLTRSNVFVNGTNRGSADVGVDDHATGGVNHAEQLSWQAALGAIQAAFANPGIHLVNVQFDVDRKICFLCQDWFDGTAYPALQGFSNANGNKNFDLIVHVAEAEADVHVLGVNETRWPADVGDEERFPLVEQLQQLLIEMGTWTENRITIYTDEHGRTTTFDYWGNDQALRDHEAQIRASYAFWKAWVETGG